MRNRMPMRSRAAGPIIRRVFLAALSLAMGCSAHPPMPERVLGSPDHHVVNGLKLIQKGRLEAAAREFGIAIDLDPESAAAHRGDSLVRGIRGDFDGAFRAVHLALRHTTLHDLGGPIQDEFTGIQSISRDRTGWRRPSREEEASDLARSYMIGFLNAYYHLGAAFKLGQGDEARDEGLREALSLTEVFSSAAIERLNMWRDVEGLGLETDFARGLVFAGQVTRTEAARLLVRELPLARVLGAKESEGPDSGSGPSPPGHSKRHSLKADVQAVLTLGIDGFVSLEGTPFQPNDPMPRAGFAAALADILSRVAGDRGMEETETRLSPFEDVPLSSPYLKAVAGCAGLGLMEGQDGVFRPDAPITGLESVRSVHRLKTFLKSR